MVKRIVVIFSIFAILLIPVSTSYSQALQEVAGQVLYQMQLGQSKTLQWGLLSDDILQLY
ncbi:MAG: hypothetical protein ACREBB_09870 [Nitrosotalea sp.]